MRGYPKMSIEVTRFEDDLLGLREFAERLDKYIPVEQGYVPGSLVIALSSKFGSGKSTFLRMWSDSIQRKAHEMEKPPFLVQLNAWESDYFGDPLYALVSALVRALEREKEGETAKMLAEAAKSAGWLAAAVGEQVASKYTGINLAAAWNSVKNRKFKQKAESAISPDAFSTYQRREEAMAALKSAIESCLLKNGKSIYFFVDELDRCRPDYAISYLETIKHVFDIKGAVFILAADRDQLKNSAKAAFGDDLDFEEYLRKFIHREVALPEISYVGYFDLIQRYTSYYLEGGNSRHCYVD